MAYGLYEFAPVTGFLATVIPEKRLLLDDLTPAPGRQAHTTSPYALASSVRTLLRAIPSRPSRPPPTFATTADVPLAGKDGGSFKVFLPDGGSGMFFARRLDRWNRVDRIEEISLWAQRAKFDPAQFDAGVLHDHAQAAERPLRPGINR